MSGHAFRPSIARVQNAQKVFTSTKTNATIRDLEEEEGELEEKEGVVVSIKRDQINGSGWTVKDNDGNIYVCSCASSMYEVPETVERGGILYPVDTVEVVFTVNPVLRINTIKEIKSLGEETEKIDISKWTHGDESTTVIAKPKSALSISDGFIKLDYNNDNKVLADKDGVKTEGAKTSINTEDLSINSNNITIKDVNLEDLIEDSAFNISNQYDNYIISGVNNNNAILSRTNNMSQLEFNDMKISNSGVIGEIKDQKLIPIRDIRQQLITDGNCVDTLLIDTNGLIVVELSKLCPEERHTTSVYNWLTPQVNARNYIKVVVKQTCSNCDEGHNTTSEFINYCPSCKSWNTLIDTSTHIKCISCSQQYCENCGSNILKPSEKLKKYRNNYITGYGTTCNYCNEQLISGTTKEYVNYCPNCKTWNTLYQEEYYDDNEIINVLSCSSKNCGSIFCCTCGIDQKHHGVTITNAPAQYTEYKKALRKLKYIRDGN